MSSRFCILVGIETFGRSLMKPPAAARPPLQTRMLRRVLGLYPLQIGKGWVASVFADHKIPEGELVQTKEGVLIRTRPDYVFKHIYLFGEFEPVNTAAFKRIIRPGDVCLDVGANIGYFTCLFARWGARVYAFEPLPSTFALNQETISLNQAGSLAQTFNQGLGERSGSLRIYQFKNLSHGHASSSDLGREDAVPHECKVTTIDAFCAEQRIEKVSFIKIDVEGFEYEVIKGGAGLLNRADAPVVHFEVNGECVRQRNLDPDEIVSLLKSYGYTSFLQIGRYHGVRKAPSTLPAANHDYLAFKDSRRAEEIFG